MRRIALGLQYDGTPWQGWQTQPHRQTVQDSLEQALAKFCQCALSTTCAGRTDAGVHALGQVVHLDTDIARDPFSWVRGVNAYLPASIAVRWAAEVAGGDDGFHARFSALVRTYHYVIYNHPVRSPLWHGRAGWAFRPLDADAMHAAAQALIGEHDFSAFRAAECQAASPVRKMQAVAVDRRGELLIVTLRANAFLQHMVRNIVGSLIQVGSANRPAAWVGELLASRNRELAAPTFSPDGLYLAKVDYDARWGLPQQCDPLHTLPFELPFN
ncbi:MAG: tRNA pseudouridine(38-40) synthase TruA [Burkholderiaceae bacterium]|nr:tRNA pseudouridine(38-40) synthase TruA [Oxalobacteraceae bacterium]